MSYSVFIDNYNQDFNKTETWTKMLNILISAYS